MLAEQTSPTKNSLPESLILFDGVCNLCNASVNFIIEHDSDKYFTFASLQSEGGEKYLQAFGFPKNNFESIILIENQKIYQKSSAVLEITRHLDGVWKVFYVFKIIPSFLGDWVYDLVARNRYKVFGKTATCRMPSDDLKDRFL